MCCNDFLTDTVTVHRFWYRSLHELYGTKTENLSVAISTLIVLSLLLAKKLLQHSITIKPQTVDHIFMSVYKQTVYIVVKSELSRF